MTNKIGITDLHGMHARLGYGHGGGGGVLGSGVARIFFSRGALGGLGFS